MSSWLYLSLIAMALWGVVGLLQKLGTNRISSRSLLVWVTAGFVLLLPWFAWNEHLLSLGSQQLMLGVVIGIVNGLGSWFLFIALERGAKASIAIPLTALYPLLTVVLATLFLSESLTGRQWVGIALAVAAAAALSYERDGSALAEDSARSAPAEKR